MTLKKMTATVTLDIMFNPIFSKEEIKDKLTKMIAIVEDPAISISDYKIEDISPIDIPLEAANLSAPGVIA